MVRIVANSEVLNLTLRGLASPQSRRVWNHPTSFSHCVRPVDLNSAGRPELLDSRMSQPITMNTSDSDSDERMNTSHIACVLRRSRVRARVKGSAVSTASNDAITAYQKE